MTNRFLRDAYRRAHVNGADLGVSDAQAAGLDVSAEASRFTALVQRHGLTRALFVFFRGAFMLYALTGAVMVAAAAAVPPAITSAVQHTAGGGAPMYQALATVSVLVAVFAVFRWLMTWQVRQLVLHSTLLTQRIIFRRLQTVDPQWLADSGKSTSSYLMAWPDQISQLVFAVEFLVYGALATVLAVQLILSFGWVGVLVMVLVAMITLVLRPLGAATVRTGMRYLELDHSRSQLVDDMARQRRQILRLSLTASLLAAVKRARSPQLQLLRRRAYLAGAYDAALDALPVIFAAALIIAVQISSGLVATAQLTGILVASRLIVTAVSENLATVRVVQSGTVAARGIDMLLRDAPTVSSPAAEGGQPPGTVTICHGDGEVIVTAGQRVAVIGADGTKVLRAVAVPDPRSDGYRVRYAGDLQWVGRDHRPFDGTIAHITTLWDPDNDESRYVTAVAHTGLDGELAARPDGDASALSATGRVLSDGQSVRLGLAQAVYVGSDIYLLDDVFAPLDPASADAVAGNLFANRNATWLFSTARPELLRHADVVLLAAADTLTSHTPTDLLSAGGFELADIMGTDAPKRLSDAMTKEPATTDPVATEGVTAESAAPPVAAGPYRRADLADMSILSASLDTHAADPQRRSSAAALFYMIFGPWWSSAMIVAAVAAILGELFLVSNNGSATGTAKAAAVTYSAVAIVVLATYLVRHVVSYQASVTPVDGLHRQVLAHVLRPGDMTAPAAIGGRIGRDFTTAETQAPRVLSLIAVGVASLILSITVVALGDPITLIPSALLAAGLGSAYMRSRGATQAVTALAGTARAPSVNFAVAAIGYLGFHSNARIRAALSRRFDDLTAIRAAAGHRLQWVRLRLLLQVELVGAGFFIASAWAAPLTSSLISPAVLLYVAYSLTQQVVTVVERAQSGEIASRQVSRILALLDGRTPPRGELIHPVEGADAPLVADPASVTLADLVVETTEDTRMTAQITLSCSPGSMTWVQGPSGIGKSTLLDTVAGVRPPRSGTVTVGAGTGVATTLLVSSDLPAIAVTVADLLGDARNSLDEVYAIARTAGPLPDAVLTDLTHRDRQLVALARARDAHASLLLLDEATSTLDPHTERSLLRYLRTAGSTMLVVSHRPDSQDLADTVLTLTGTAAEVSSPAGAPMTSVSATVKEP